MLTYFGNCDEVRTKEHSSHAIYSQQHSAMKLIPDDKNQVTVLLHAETDFPCSVWHSFSFSTFLGTQPTASRMTYYQWVLLTLPVVSTQQLSCWGSSLCLTPGLGNQVET